MGFAYIYIIFGISAVSVSIGKALAVNFGISKYLSKKPYEGDYNFKKVVLYTLGTNYILLSTIVLFILGVIVKKFRNFYRASFFLPSLCSTSSSNSTSPMELTDSIPFAIVGISDISEDT